MIVLFMTFLFSKVKRRLEKKPPKRSTICTTPRFLMKKKGKAQKKEQKQTAGAELPTAEQQQEEVKKTKGGGKKDAPKGRGKEKRKNAAQKMGSNSSGVKLKKYERWSLCAFNGLQEYVKCCNKVK